MEEATLPLPSSGGGLPGEKNVTDEASLVLGDFFVYVCCSSYKTAFLQESRQRRDDRDTLAEKIGDTLGKDR